MVIRMRHTSSHTKNRRSHHALKEKGVTVDKETGNPHLRHRVDSVTGKYKGRQVIDVHAQLEKKAKKQKEKEKAMGLEREAEAEAKQDESKKLDPADLSKK